MAYKWKPNKAEKQAFAEKMKEVKKYCAENNISVSTRGDSYYFTHENVEYRISNHAVEKSVSNTGEMWHGDSKNYREKVFCIHAGKTRIIEIHKAVTSGKIINHKGEIIE